ncbi:MAG: histidine kinase [Gammaproteobacteria bacterium]|nr:hypothetical protein [Chromatiales bacterium]MDX5333999.1 histidine kinase [Gammaproteobacteria bacterium]
MPGILRGVPAHVLGFGLVLLPTAAVAAPPFPGDGFAPLLPLLVTLLLAIAVILGLLLYRCRSAAVRRQDPAAPLAALLEHLPVFYYRIDARGCVTAMHGQGAACLDDDPQALIGRRVCELFPGAGEAAERALAGEQVQFEAQGVSRDRLWWIASTIVPSAGGALGLGIDITSHKTEEVKAVGLARENRELARRLVEIQEEERNLLAREMHDELGQSLTAIHTLATAIGQRQGQQDQIDDSRPVHDVGALAGNIVELSTRLYDVVRSIMHRLRPDVVDGLDFGDALQTCIDNAQLEAMGVRVDVELPQSLGPLDDVVKISLYRILQEGLTNIAKYAMASRVHIRLTRTPGAALAGGVERLPDRLELCITDDGVGMAPGASAGSGRERRGSGLRGMHERVHALGGELFVDSAPGKGVAIRACLDVEPFRPKLSV